MAKRRTRKQKEKAKHHFLASEEPLQLSAKEGEEIASKQARVKGQKKKEEKTIKSKSQRRKNTDFSADYENLNLIKRDLLKSLIIASLILSLEVVIYLSS